MVKYSGSQNVTGQPLEEVMREIVLTSVVNEDFLQRMLLSEEHLAVKLPHGKVTIIPMEMMYKNYGGYKN